jgi:nitrate reductase NapE component
MADMPWLAIALGGALTGLIVWLHPVIFGGNPTGR